MMLAPVWMPFFLLSDSTVETVNLREDVFGVQKYGPKMNDFWAEDEVE